MEELVKQREVGMQVKAAVEFEMLWNPKYLQRRSHKNPLLQARLGTV